MKGWLVKEIVLPILSDIHTVNETSRGVVFILFASELSVFPQYDVSIKLPIINGNDSDRYCYSSPDFLLKVSATVTID